MEVIDLSENFDQYKHLWDETLNIISDSNDRLKENYLDIDPEKYICFTALIDQNKIICFSGLQSEPLKWGNKIARCSSRMWIHPDYRFQGMTKFTKGSKFLNSYYCLPIQLSRSKELGYDCIFMSRDSNRDGFSSWCDLVNQNCDTDFKILNHRYNLCGNVDNPADACFQYIAVDQSNDLAIDIWNKNMSVKILTD